MNGQALTLPVVVTAALLDSVNPCAVAVLLTFVAATLVLAKRTSAQGLAARWLLWRTGLVYLAGVFVTYLGLGLGLPSGPAGAVVCWFPQLFLAAEGGFLRCSGHGG